MKIFVGIVLFCLIGTALGACTSNQMECSNGKCIPRLWRCDNLNDCDDQSDEIGCAYLFGARTSCDEYPCLNGQVISASEVCNSSPKCSYGEDDLGCGNCGLLEYQCGNGNCIHQNKLCDQNDDCGDNTDESGCPSAGGMKRMFESTILSHHESNQKRLLSSNREALGRIREKIAHLAETKKSSFDKEKRNDMNDILTDEQILKAID